MERLDKLQIWCGDGDIEKNLCLLKGYSDSTIRIASQLTTEMEVYIREFVCKIKFVRKLVAASHQEWILTGLQQKRQKNKWNWLTIETVLIAEKHFCKNVKKMFTQIYSWRLIAWSIG